MPITEGGQFTPDSQILSPGVFSRELDQSQYNTPIQDLGGVIVAPFSQGPAFSPVSFTNVNLLQSQFGTPDGVYYGPYTAIQYLQQQGIVTVCRVGALTGYHQNYPFAIWAVKGEWNRGQSVGALVSQSSYIYFYGSQSNQYSESISWVGNQMTINTASLTITFAGSPADDLALNLSGSNSSSGSLLYYGQTLTLGNATIINALANVSQSQFSSSIANGTFSASITGPTPITFPGLAGLDQGPALEFFQNLIFISASISVNLTTCNFPILNLSGIVSGTFGQFNGTFTATTSAFNPCILPDGQWVTQSGADTRLLCLLADTEAGGIQNLQAPGFYGSTLSLATPVSQSNVIPSLFNLTLKNSLSPTPYGTYQFSLNSSNPNFITNVFGNNAAVGNPSTQVAGQKIEAAYLYSIYENSLDDVIVNNDNWMIVGGYLPSGSWTGESLDFTDQYSLNPTVGDSQFAITNAYTPWVVSQAIAPWQSGSSVPTRFNLFQIFTQADGTYTNQQIKIEISNVRLSGQVAGSDWGSFTLQVRQYGDTDRNPVILEQYQNLTLDPNASNYLPRVIGDQYNYISAGGKLITFGIYPNNSQYIYIQMSGQNYPETAIPYGFQPYSVPANGEMGYWTPKMKYTKASVYGLNPGKYPSGINFDDAPSGADVELASLYPTLNSGSIGTADDNLQYFSPVPLFSNDGGTYLGTGRNEVFALDINYNEYGVGIGSYLNPSLANFNGNAIPTIYDPVNEPTYVLMRNFIFGFQGGFDGQSPAIPINTGANISAGNTQGLNCTTVNSAGSVAYDQCIEVLGNASQYDINLIVTPGILYQLHPYVTNLVVNMCQTRGDVFYILDLYLDSGNPPITENQINTVISYAAEFDTNYAATYYPWVRILDTFNNLIVTVPPSVVLPAVYAANDAIAAEWFAPAGLNRGGISIATGVTDRTTAAERDLLYQGKVNPIASFPGTGVGVWGQKTLTNVTSALNRINVRRLLINLKKFFNSVSQYLIFEQNVAATRNKFLAIVNPYMESVQQRSGLYAFYVQMDQNTNTPDIIDQNILYGKIFIQPTKVSEFIVLDFNIQPTGASLPNA